MSRTAADRDAITAARLVENLAYRIPAACDAVARRFAELDGTPPGRGYGAGGGCGEGGSIVDRHAVERASLYDDLDQLAADVQAIRAITASATAIVERLMAGGRGGHVLVQVCSSYGLAGADLPWTKGGKVEDGNGWADPACHDVAEVDQLCGRCAKRYERWCDRQLVEA